MILFGEGLADGRNLLILLFAADVVNFLRTKLSSLSGKLVNCV